jgi:serine/threonine-protein kinase HipA
MTPKDLRRLFGVTWLPSIPFGLDNFQNEVSQVVAQNPMSISGVQKKASVLLNRKTHQLEIVSIGGTHILKPEVDQYPEIPKIENLCMNMAERASIEVPAHGLLPMKDGSLCYIVRRFDRLADGSKSGQEDMKQILGARDKYEGSLESIGKVLLKHAARPGLEVINFFERVVFCFLIGNGDMHLKNWSMIEPKDQQYRLTPAYDMVSSSLYFPQETESALTVAGKKNRLTRSDFEGLANYLNIDVKAARASLRRLLGMQTLFQQMIQESELHTDRKVALSDLIQKRFARLQEPTEPTPKIKPSALIELRNSKDPNNPPSDMDHRIKLSNWTDQSERRLELLLNFPDRIQTPFPYAHGRWVVSYLLVGQLNRPGSLSDFRETLRSVEDKKSGWPVWWVPLNEHKPIPVADVIECHLFKTYSGEPGVADFWRASPQGSLYLTRGYLEDGPTAGMPPGKQVGLVLPIRIIAESILHAERLARAFGDPKARLYFYARWEGLQGRKLTTWGSPNRLLSGPYQSHQERFENDFVADLTEVNQDLPDLLFRFVRPFYEIFDFFNLSKKLATEILEEIRLSGTR